MIVFFFWYDHVLLLLFPSIECDNITIIIMAALFVLKISSVYLIPKRLHLNTGSRTTFIDRHHCGNRKAFLSRQELRRSRVFLIHEREATLTQKSIHKSMSITYESHVFCPPDLYQRSLHPELVVYAILLTLLSLKCGLLWTFASGYRYLYQTPHRFVKNKLYWIRTYRTPFKAPNVLSSRWIESVLRRETMQRRLKDQVQSKKWI